MTEPETHNPLNRVKPVIAMVVKGFPVLSQTFISLQIAELSGQGYDLRIINLGKKGSYEMAPGPLKNVIENLKVYSLFQESDPYILTSAACFLKTLVSNMLFTPGPFFKSFRYLINGKSLKYFFNLHRDAYLLRKTEGCDLIHCQFATLADRLVSAEKAGLFKTQAKLVCSIRGYDITKKIHIEGIDWNYIFRVFDMFLPVCNYFIPVLRKMGCNKAVAVVYSPVNTLVFESFRKEKAADIKSVRIISVGRLIEKKGFDDAIKAVALLSKSFRSFTYKIVGDGPSMDLLQSEITDNNLGGQVELLGKLPPEKTLEVIADSDIMLAPSRESSDGDSEGIPNVIKEAMLLGLQVITTYHAGIPELVDNGVNGFLVSENSPEAIAEVLHRLFSDKSDWRSRSDKAREKAGRLYSVETTTTELIKAYESLKP